MIDQLTFRLYSKKKYKYIVLQREYSYRKLNWNMMDESRLEYSHLSNKYLSLIFLTSNMIISELL
jgi:hypothetical protein